MDQVIDTTPTIGAINIDGEFTIYRAEAICNTLRHAVSQGGDLELDLRDVSEFDSAGLQIVLAAQRSVHARAAVFRVVGISAAVAEVFGMLGLSDQLAAMLLGMPATPLH